MRARAIREGSVGLLILISVGLFGGLVLWLRGLNPGSRTYTVVFVFENTLGMQSGTAVRYRGVPVGRVLAIDPDANEVKVLTEITAADLRIPKSLEVRANQSGLIGDTTIDLTPLALLATEAENLTPFGEDCNAELIVCDGDVIRGDVGASYESLLRSAEKLANTFGDPEIAANLNTTLANASTLTAKASGLTDEITTLTLSAQAEVKPLADSARRAADNIGDAAAEFELTGSDVNQLLATNRANIDQTLVNVNVSSQRLASLMAELEPAVRDSEFLRNLDILSANAVQASADLRQITGAINSTDNLVMLQQTLGSARTVFQSAQKILGDVDELTGDPAFRLNLRNLINGLSQLVSSTEALEQQMELVERLAPAAGHPTATLTLTPLPGFDGSQAAPGPVLMARNGQYYRLEFAAPGAASAAAPATP